MARIAGRAWFWARAAATLALLAFRPWAALALLCVVAWPCALVLCGDRSDPRNWF